LAKPIVTVGICVRNGAKSLCEAIDSIRNQDFPHELIEVIFVDDGSTDDTLKMIKYCTSTLGMSVKIFNQNWKGLGASRNVVFAHAKGSLILWLDADMTISKEYVPEQVRFMSHNPTVGIVKGTESIEPSENLVATLETYSRAASRMVDYSSDSGKLKSLGAGGSICRFEALRQVGGFDPKITGYGEDFDVERRIRRAGWQLATIEVQFRDHERGKLSWKDVWRRYTIRGIDMCKISPKWGQVLQLPYILPPSAFLAGFLHSLKIYRLTRRKAAFLLPLQYVFKMTALCLGLMRGIRL